MMIMSLRSSRHRARWQALLAATLSVFVLGTNYCLLVAFGGTVGGAPRFTCHADASAPASAHECCRRSAPGKSKAPAASPGFPCCIQVAPPSGPHDAKPDLVVTAFAVADPTLEISPAAISCGAHPEARSAPPPESFPDVQRGRAPPLS